MLCLGDHKICIAKKARNAEIKTDLRKAFVVENSMFRKCTITGHRPTDTRE